MSAIVSMFDQILVRVNCTACGPSEVKVGQLIGKSAFACGSCGKDMRLDQEPLKSHLAIASIDGLTAPDLAVRLRTPGRRVLHGMLGTSDPSPSPALAARASPPCISTRPLTTARPTPRPPWARSRLRSAWVKTSKMWGRTSGAIP